MTTTFDKSALRIAVLGCGSIGRRHLANLRQLGVGNLAAYDPDAAGRAAAAEMGVAASASLDVVWRWRPDAALVAAPTQHHLALAEAVVQHGCHLFIEKPLAHSLDGIDALAAELARRGLISMVGCNMRFHYGPRTVKAWLDEGRIGTPIAARVQTGSYLPRWRPQQNYKESYSAHPHWGGAILDCIHELDLARWYLGPAKLVGSCWTPARPIGLETDGLAEMILQHDGGAISNVHLNFIQRDYRRTCQIIGGEGTIYWDWQLGRVVRYDAAGSLAEELTAPADWEPNAMYVAELRHFLEAAAAGAPAVNPVAEAAATLALALAARSGPRSTSA